LRWRRMMPFTYQFCLFSRRYRILRLFREPN
jgi:hypothetical protein